ncbi:transmembrane amino acid transporter protein-domain-containing protein [Jimgerdemannia flammicorona]|nr:transmembrane amino acid transporter protein-domain-containing protein [Jimgerdemannia flammicorona]
MAPECSLTLPHPPALAPAMPPTSTLDYQTLQADHPGYGTRSMIEVSFNLVNAIVGAGIIGLPFALKEAGFWGGLLVSGWVIVLTHVAMYILILSGRRVGIYKYALLAEHALGKVGFHTVNFMLFFQTAGSAVGYYIIIGDTIPVVLGLYFPEYWLLADRVFIIILVSIIFIIPLSLPRSIGAIANWSIFSVLLLPIILLSIIIRAPAYAPKHDAPLTWTGTNVFPAIGIMAFAFVSSHVALMNYLSLKEQRSKTWGWTSAIANGTSWVISMTFAIVGYMSFGVDAKPNLFNNFEGDDVIINIGRFSLGVSLILTVP